MKKKPLYFSPETAARKFAGLPEKDKRVIEMFAMGYSAGNIASMLKKSRTDINERIRRVCDKLKVTTTAQLKAVAILSESRNQKLPIA